MFRMVPMVALAMSIARGLVGDGRRREADCLLRDRMRRSSASLEHIWYSVGKIFYQIRKILWVSASYAFGPCP
jgi:hypothetical protein